MTQSVRALELPREHGFWVMLTCVLGSGLARAAFAPAAVFTAMVLAALCSLAAAVVGRAVRRRGALQVASSALIGASAWPVLCAGGVRSLPALWFVVAWTAILTSSSLVVRAAFARSSQKARRRAVVLSAAAPGVSLVAAALLAYAGATREAHSALIAAGVCAAINAFAPSIKRVKLLGLLLAALALLESLALSL